MPVLDRSKTQATPRSPQPAPPVRQFSFTDFQVNNPSAPLPADRIDGEIDRTNNALSDTIDWAAVSLNSDGSLKPQSVGKAQLQPGLFDHIASPALDEIQGLVNSARAASREAIAAGQEADASSLAAGTQNALAQDAAGRSTSDAQDAASSAAEAAASANAALASANNSLNSANHADLAEANCIDYGVLTQAWAEHMPDTIPPNILAVMDVTGDHWSSRWWANQAAQMVAGGAQAIVTLADTPPAPAKTGQLWWDAIGGQLYVYYDDGSSKQWVSAVNRAGPAGPQGPAGAQGPTGATGPAGGLSAPALTAGSVLFATGAATLGQDNAKLFWDDANNRLGIGTITPHADLGINGVGLATGGYLVNAYYSSGWLYETTQGAGALTPSNAGGGGVVVQAAPTGTGGAAAAMTSVALFGGNGGIATATYAGVNAPPANGMIVPGNVGIGTTGPINKLDVGGSVTVAGGEALLGNIYYNAGWKFRGASGFGGGFGFGTADPAISMYVATGNTGANSAASVFTAMTIASAGGVVIGSPTGGQKGAGTLNASTVYGNNVVLTSDQDLKTDIEPLTQALAQVAAIEPKSFRWKPLPDVEGPDGEAQSSMPPDFTDKLNRGFLAQNVAEVLGGLPEGVDLGGMVAVLWQAVRELLDRVDELEGEKPVSRTRRH